MEERRKSEYTRVPDSEGVRARRAPHMRRNAQIFVALLGGLLLLSTPVAPTALASAEGLGPLCTPGDITNLTPPTISPSGSFVWASNTKTLTTTAGTWSSSCPVTYSYKWIREQTGAQVSSTSSYTVTEADATSRYTFHSEVMACDQAECSAWVPSSNSATLRISHPAKAVTFPCMTNAFDATYPWDDTNRITVLNAMKDAGVGWIRLNFVHWDKAETPHDNDYQDGTGQYLDLLKHCVNLITSTPYNMKVLLVIEQTPSWAGATLHSPPNDCTSNSSSCATFKDFLYHLLTVTLPSYQSKIAIQVWNEQNAQAHWTGSDDQYYFLLRSAYSKVKAINSSILVMTGGVSRLVGGPPPTRWRPSSRTCTTTTTPTAARLRIRARPSPGAWLRSIRIRTMTPTRRPTNAPLWAQSSRTSAAPSSRA